MTRHAPSPPTFEQWVEGMAVVNGVHPEEVKDVLRRISRGEADHTPSLGPPATWDAAIIRTTSPGGKVSEFRIGAPLDGPGPVVIAYDAPGGPTSDARALFEDARQEADTAIARAIMGDPLEGRELVFEPVKLHPDCAATDGRVKFFEPKQCAFCGQPLDTRKADHALDS